jgi:periplasmic protein TonB
MSKQTKHRYLNSFFITTILYLVASFFFFYVFADTLVVEEKKQEELKISLNSMMAVQEPTPTTQATPSEPIIEPIIERKTDRPKKERKPEEKKSEHKKHEHKKHIKEPIVEKTTEFSETLKTNNEVIQNTKPIVDTPTNQTNTAQIENIEAAYLSLIRSAIEKNKTYPKVAKRLNQTGKVYVTFLVTKDGAIKNCRINKSSNFESLDEASMEILMKIVSFEAIPKELNKDSWEITVPIVYQIS